MPDDEVEVRSWTREATAAFVDAELARRRKRRPLLDEIEPDDLPARLQQVEGGRRRLRAIRVLAREFHWRWPWTRLAGVDIEDCDLEGASIRGGLLRSVDVDDCRFDQVDLGSARIGARFTNCVFIGLRLGTGTATTIIEGGAFRRASFTRLDARGTTFAKVTFEDCSFDGIRGRVTQFDNCTFVRTDFRGALSDVGFVDCRFEAVDMAAARLTSSYLKSRSARELVYPADPHGFVIETSAYREVVANVRTMLEPADVDALAGQFVDGGYAPTSELVIDDGTLEELSTAGRARLQAALFERRLVRRG